MKKLIYSLGAIFIAIGLTGCGQPSPAEMKIIKQECKTKDNFKFHQGECLETYKIIGEKKDAINVVLHGHSPPRSGKMAIGVMKMIAEPINESTKYTTYYYARPHVAGSSSNIFTYDKKVSEQTIESYIKFNADFIKKLMNEEKVNKINLYGFSAGTTLIQNMIPLLPNNSVKKVVLIAGQFNVNEHRSNKRGKMVFVGGIQPTNQADKLDKNTKYLLISGNRDSECPTKLSKDYANELTKNNIQNKFIEMKQEDGDGHKDLFWYDKILKRASDFLK